MLSTYDTREGWRTEDWSNNFPENYNSNCIYPDSTFINSLDIADCLKELLIKYGYTLEELSNISSSELAEYLGIDPYVAKIICAAAMKLSNSNLDI
jgi:hypothetical protein